MTLLTRRLLVMAFLTEHFASVNSPNRKFANYDPPN